MSTYKMLCSIIMIWKSFELTSSKNCALVQSYFLYSAAWCHDRFVSEYIECKFIKIQQQMSFPFCAIFWNAVAYSNETPTRVYSSHAACVVADNNSLFKRALFLFFYPFPSALYPFKCIYILYTYIWKNTFLLCFRKTMFICAIEKCTVARASEFSFAKFSTLINK